MSKIYTTTLRLNLGNEDDRRAYEYLRQMDKRCYKSYSAAIVAAINDHFSRRERLADDPFLETRERQDAFLSEVKDAVRDCLREQQIGLGGLAALLQSAQIDAPTPEAMSEEAFDTAMDFIGQL